MENNKHAFLIMAHNEFDLLERLVLCLDNENNDIYVHIDKKVKDFDFDRFVCLPHKSKIFFTSERIDVKWGDISIVEATLLLLTEAINSHYYYYHLISGADLPIKSNSYIHSFFVENNGYEFVHFNGTEKIDFVQRRHKYYYLLNDYRSSELYLKATTYGINKVIHKFQDVFKIYRVLPGDYDYKYGSAWFSITDEFANYIVSCKEWIIMNYKHSLLPDESFVQTLLYNSEFYNKVYMKPDLTDNHMACCRKIDWKRGGPYVWKNEDFNELIASSELFARKFSMKEDKEIIENILNCINEDN